MLIEKGLSQLSSEIHMEEGFLSPHQQNPFSRCARVKLNHNSATDSREYILIYYYTTPLCFAVNRLASTHLSDINSPRVHFVREHTT